MTKPHKPTPGELERLRQLQAERAERERSQVSEPPAEEDTEGPQPDGGPESRPRT